jgi:hypothetical protein
MCIISRAGKELAADALSIDYQHWEFNDYTVVEVSGSDDPLALDMDRSYVARNLRNLVRVMPRDWRDHIVWLVKRGRYEEVLTTVEKLEAEEGPSCPKRTQIECKRSGRRILSTLFTKVVSSNKGIIISSCTSPMLRGYERQGIN